MTAATPGGDRPPGRLRRMAAAFGQAPRAPRPGPKLCPGCRFRLDPIADAEFGGRHGMCSLPPGDRAVFQRAHEAGLALIRAEATP